MRLSSSSTTLASAVLFLAHSLGCSTTALVTQNTPANSPSLAPFSSKKEKDFLDSIIKKTKTERLLTIEYTPGWNLVRVTDRWVEEGELNCTIQSDNIDWKEYPEAVLEEPELHYRTIDEKVIQDYRALIQQVKYAGSYERKKKPTNPTFQWNIVPQNEWSSSCVPAPNLAEHAESVMKMYDSIYLDFERLEPQRRSWLPWKSPPANRFDPSYSLYLSLAIQYFDLIQHGKWLESQAIQVR